MTPLLNRSRSNQGFTLIEMLIAIGITAVVMASVFQLLKGGQDSFRREPEVADMTANARAGLDLISRDLANAGLKTPPRLAISWSNGGGNTPDEVTIIFADPDIPLSEPMCTGGGGGCGTIKQSSSLLSIPIPWSLRPRIRSRPIRMDRYCSPIETEDCNGDGPSMIPFTLTQDPTMSAALLRLNQQSVRKLQPAWRFQRSGGRGLLGHRRVPRDSVSHQPASTRSPSGPRKARLGPGRGLDPGGGEHREPSVSIQPGHRAAIRRRARYRFRLGRPQFLDNRGPHICLRQKREHQLERRHRWGLRCRGYALEADVHHLRDTSQPARARRRVGGGERRRGLELSSRSTSARAHSNRR